MSLIADIVHEMAVDTGLLFYDEETTYSDNAHDIYIYMIHGPHIINVVDLFIVDNKVCFGHDVPETISQSQLDALLNKLKRLKQITTDLCNNSYLVKTSSIINLEFALNFADMAGNYRHPTLMCDFQIQKRYARRHGGNWSLPHLSAYVLRDIREVEWNTVRKISIDNSEYPESRYYQYRARRNYYCHKVISTIGQIPHKKVATKFSPERLYSDRLHAAAAAIDYLYTRLNTPMSSLEIIKRARKHTKPLAIKRLFQLAHKVVKNPYLLDRHYYTQNRKVAKAIIRSMCSNGFQEIIMKSTYFQQTFSPSELKQITASAQQ